MKLKKLVSKVLIVLMLFSYFLYVPKTHAETTPTITVNSKTLWINGSVNININNKVSGSDYTWATSDSSIAVVDNRGIVTGLKSGKVDIICTVTTKDNTYKLVSHITISIGSIVVKNQEQLEAALNNKEITKIMIQTSGEDKFNIPEKDYSDKCLYIKAPSAQININGDFKSVHAYVSKQDQLDTVLKDPKITIVTINTDSNEDFNINGDYPSVRIIINAPNSNVVATGQFRRVDVNEVNTINLPLEGKDDTTAEETTPEPTQIPTPVVDTQPSVPSQPVVTPTPVPATPTPTPVNLDTLKRNAIDDINNQASVLIQTLTGTEKTDFEDLINNLINQINVATTSTMVNTFHAIAISEIEYYGQEPINQSNIDYQAYLAGDMTMQDLYSKYAKTSEGYTYTIPNNGVFYFEAGTEMVYVDYQNNKTYLFAYEDFHGLTVDEFINEITDRVSTDNYLDVVSDQYDGCIVSYNTSERTLNIYDPTRSASAYITKTVTSMTEWTAEDGKKYRQYTGDSSSLNYIFTDFGTSSLVSVSGSAISVDLYMNNTTEVNRVVVEGINNILDTSYYTVDYNVDNTARITFNENFYNDYLIGNLSSNQVKLNLYPTVSTDYVTELTFIIN